MNPLDVGPGPASYETFDYLAINKPSYTRNAALSPKRGVEHRSLNNTMN
jgi:hypothetical protein